MTETTAVRENRVAPVAELATDTPEVVVDLSTLRANIARASALAYQAGVSLRPHVKTHKLPQIARMQLDAGAVGIQVAKLGEAEVMAGAGIRDILVGYPLVGEKKLARLRDLAESASISVALDSAEVAQGISRVARELGASIRVLLEIDTGLARLGVEPGPPAAEAAARIAGLPGIELVGIFTHEGHVYTRGRSVEEKERLTQEACYAMAETAAQLRARGIRVDVVSVGSTVSFRFAVTCPGVTEVRPGTYVFNDGSQIANGSATEADIAAFVVATVVSRPARNRVVVDAGSKILSNDPLGVPEPPRTFGAVWGREDWDITRLSEEHGVVAVPEDAEVAVGDRLVIVPNHICAVINLADSVTVVEDGRLVDRWQVAARGRVQ